MKASAKDLRFHTKDMIDSVNRGEEIVITFRGKSCAKLVSCQVQKKKTGKNELYGIWKDNDAIQRVDEYVSNLRKGR